MTLFELLAEKSLIAKEDIAALEAEAEAAGNAEEALCFKGGIHTIRNCEIGGSKIAVACHFDSSLFLSGLRLIGNGIAIEQTGTSYVSMEFALFKDNDTAVWLHDGVRARYSLCCFLAQKECAVRMTQRSRARLYKNQAPGQCALPKAWRKPAAGPGGSEAPQKNPRSEPNGFCFPR